MNCILEVKIRLKATELEALVKERYGISISVTQCTAQVPGSILEFNVDPVPPEVLDPIRKGKRSRFVTNYLRTLAADGVIPYGRFIVDTTDDPVSTTGKWSRGQLKIVGVRS